MHPKGCTFIIKIYLFNKESTSNCNSNVEFFFFFHDHFQRGATFSLKFFYKISNESPFHLYQWRVIEIMIKIIMWRLNSFFFKKISIYNLLYFIYEFLLLCVTAWHFTYLLSINFENVLMRMSLSIIYNFFKSLKIIISWTLHVYFG